MLIPILLLRVEGGYSNTTFTETSIWAKDQFAQPLRGEPSIPFRQPDIARMGTNGFQYIKFYESVADTVYIT